MKAPKVNVFDVLLDRCNFRLQNSRQTDAIYTGYSILGDIRDLYRNVKRITNKKAKLVVTSPPYIRITSYEEDQWLRLWFLGYQPYPHSGRISKDDKIRSQDKYINFLSDSWISIRQVMDSKGTLICRLGQSSKDNFSLDFFMKESIKRSGKRFKIVSASYSPFKKTRQAKMFGSKLEKKSGEHDFILQAC